MQRIRGGKFIIIIEIFNHVSRVKQEKSRKRRDLSLFSVVFPDFLHIVPKGVKK